MANSDPSPLPLEIDPQQAQVLFAGNLADDDFLWIVRCSAREYHRLIESPVAWVAALAALPGWQLYGSDHPAPVPVLAREFSMVVREATTPDPDGWLLVQGISHTNELSVFASREAAIRSFLAQAAVAPLVAEGLGITPDIAEGVSGPALLEASDDPFGPFWDAVAKDPDNPPTFKKRYPVTIVRSLGRFYGHFEITEPGESPVERAARNASFLLAVATDPNGYARMLTSLDQVTLYARPEEVVEGSPIAIFPPAHGATVVYAAVDETGITTGEDDQNTSCSMTFGETTPLPPPPPAPPTDPTSGTPDGTVIKFYRVPRTQE